MPKITLTFKKTAGSLDVLLLGSEVIILIFQKDQIAFEEHYIVRW